VDTGEEKIDRAAQWREESERKKRGLGLGIQAKSGRLSLGGGGFVGEEKPEDCTNRESQC
jgi:hypothetical protein